VAAPDERRARLYAANAFADPAAPRAASGPLPGVVAAERTAGPGAGTVAEGTVMVPDTADDPRGAFRVLAHGEA
jgi:hypothetical protein